MKKSLVLVFLVVTGLSFAQSGKLKRADNYFDKIAYASASTLYEELLGSDVETQQIKSRLAYCYYQMGNVERAEEVYGQLMTQHADNITDTTDYFYYAQVLKQNGNYKESDQWMTRYHGLANKDLRAIEFVENENYIQQIEKSGNKFTIKHLRINSSATDFGGYIIGETLFFISSRTENPFIKRQWMWNNKHFLDLYSVQLKEDQVDSLPKLFTKRVNTKFHEGPLCFSPDGKVVYYTRNNIATGQERKDVKGIQNLKLYISDVVDDHIWINEREFTYNSKEYSLGHPSISNDGQTLYFVSDMPGGYGGADVYKVAILDDRKFGKPENLGNKVNTEGQDMFPWINEDNLLFFSSDGHVGLGGLDVFVGLPNRSGGIAKILNVGKPVNSNRDDFAFIMDKTSLKGYFSSNRSGGSGDDDIYSYKLEKPIRPGVNMNGVARDPDNNIIAGVEVILMDKEGNMVDETTTDNLGNYNFDLEPDKNYTIRFKKLDYFTNSLEITTNNIPEDATEMKQDIVLQPDVLLVLYGLIIDNETLKPIAGVNIEIDDYNKETKVLAMTTPDSGDFTRPLTAYNIGDELEFKIQLSKKGYHKKTVLFSHTIERMGMIRLQQYLNVTLDAVNPNATYDPTYNSQGENLGPELALYGLIVDANTGKPLADVNIEIEDFNKQEKVLSMTTPETGDFVRPLSTYKIGDELEFKITLSRAGYYKKTVLFSHKVKKIGAISIHQYLNVTLDVAQTLMTEDGTKIEKESPIYTDKGDKLDSGVDLAKVIEIEPIYFDLSKWNIRTDAALELEKIISVMNKYPTMEIELGSHTDCRSSKAFNQNLSDKRAKSSASYIQSKITNPSRIKGRGYGESKLVNDCGCEGKVKSTCSEEEHQANRRTEFIIQKM